MKALVGAFLPTEDPIRGLLRDCEIFGYLRITFDGSSILLLMLSTEQNVTDYPKNIVAACRPDDGVHVAAAGVQHVRAVGVLVRPDGGDHLLLHRLPRRHRRGRRLLHRQRHAPLPARL